MNSLDSWQLYQKVKIVGRGANGIALLCKRKKDNASVVIKELFGTNVLQSEDALNEIQVLSIVRHANIIAYYDSFSAEMKEEHEIMEESTEEKPIEKETNLVAPLLRARTSMINTNGNPMTLYIVMEYADGGTLETYLSELNSCISEHVSIQSLTSQDILYMFSQILFALHHVHSHNILHRDLKTGNIFISGKGSQMILKIGDFGISKLLSQENKAETIVGTPNYLSPELCQGNCFNDKSDIWALGCILYEFMCRRKMFEASNLPALVMKIVKGQSNPMTEDGLLYSEELKKLVYSCCNLDLEQRPDAVALMGSMFLQEPLMDTQFSIGRILQTDEVNFL